MSLYAKTRFDDEMFASLIHANLHLERNYTTVNIN